MGQGDERATQVVWWTSGFRYRKVHLRGCVARAAIAAQILSFEAILAWPDSRSCGPVAPSRGRLPPAVAVVNRAYFADLARRLLVLWESGGFRPSLYYGRGPSKTWSHPGLPVKRPGWCVPALRKLIPAPLATLTT